MCLSVEHEYKQAQKKVETALEMKRAAAQVKLEAQKIQEETATQATQLVNQKRQVLLPTQLIAYSNYKN
jgi:hypothetical protein